MTTPTNGLRPASEHTVTLLNRFGNSITAPVVYVKPLGNGQAEVNIETNFHIEVGHAHPATYATPGHEAKGRYKVQGIQFTERATYVYKGTFERK